MADYISAELAATCDALGYYDGATYHLDSDALSAYIIIFIYEKIKLNIVLNIVFLNFLINI